LLKNNRLLEMFAVTELNFVIFCLGVLFLNERTQFARAGCMLRQEISITVDFEINKIRFLLFFKVCEWEK